MRPSIPLGRVAGIPIGLHWSALIGIALLTQLLGFTVLPALAPTAPGGQRWVAAGMAAVVLVTSLLAHELAHAFVARRAGVRVRRITLWLLGGVSELADPMPGPDAEVRIALAGPATSLLLGTIFMVAAGTSADLGTSGLTAATLSWLSATNVVLAVFNLLPGTPLDGGRVVHGLWWRRTGSRTGATRAAGAAGRLLGALLAGFGALMVLGGRLDGLWLGLVGWFLAGSAIAEPRAAVTSAALAGVRTGDVMSVPAEVVPTWWPVSAMIARLADGTLHHRGYPVTDVDGRVVGVVTLADLARCPDGRREENTVGGLARPLPAEHVVTIDASLESLLRCPPRPNELVVVLDGPRVAGVIGHSDLARAVELAGLTGDRPERSG